MTRTRAPGNLYPKRRRTEPGEKAEIFRQAVLVNGAARGVDFVEIYESDAADPALEGVIRRAHEQLHKPDDR